MPDKLTDSEIVKALERLKNTKDYLKEQYQEQVKKCPYPELKPIAKRTYEDNKKAFDIAIKAIEEFNRLQAEKEALISGQETLQKYIADLQAENEQWKEEANRYQNLWCEAEKDIQTAKAEAYKECIEKAKSEIDSQSHSRSLEASGERFRIHKILDNLLNELVGEPDES
jgi:predicted  nucleic acid-binding Zn-ribbon protein